MTALDAANRYFDAWNARDADAVLASLAPGGTYEDPATGGQISGEALRAYVGGLWAAFPDLNFEIVSAGESGGGQVAAQWIMRGTNRGSFNGLPPSGLAVELRGADFLRVADGKVAAVTGYFDPGALPRQLGLQVVVQPQAAGPFRFGTAVAARTGRTEAPGAFSVTQLTALDEAAAQDVANRSREIVAEMLGAPGFIGVVTARIGLRMMTISAWSDPEAAAGFARGGRHGAAMRPFFEGALARDAYTSAWVPARINPYWVRCEACHAMMDAAKAGGTCRCGATLPGAPAYW